MGHNTADREASRLSLLNINEIESEVRGEITLHLSWLINAMIEAGRINGKGVEILSRIEDETIRVIREHWVK